MPRSVYKPPFHRRILPWVFAIVFATLAPTLIFYTSGYRINPKKVTIERNGTLIADSTPSGARILLNGIATKYVTPSSILNVAPGPYEIRYEQTGYVPWQKTLDIRAEQATFADKIRLWIESEASALNADSAYALIPNADGNRVAAIIPRPNGLGVRILDAEGASVLDVTLASFASSSRPDIRWNDAGTYLLLDDTDPKRGDLWLNIGNGQTGSLPAGHYRWDASILIGISSGSRITYDPRRGTFAREQLSLGIADETDTFDLLMSTSTGDLSVRPHSILRRQYALPRGNWRVDGTSGAYTLLRKDSTWLAVKRNGEPESGTAEGERPMWNGGNALLHNGNEIWIWTPGEEPQLLLRQSEPFVQVTWHEAGDHVFVATKTRVFALELDDRSGRLMTDLATGFDSVQAMSAIGGNLLIAGTKNGVNGTFIRPLE